MKTFNTIKHLSFTFACIFFLISCGKEEVETIVDPCDEIFIYSTQIRLNSVFYNLNEFDYTTDGIASHNFKVVAYDESCITRLEIVLDFAQDTQHPDSSLERSYSPRFATDPVDLELGEMSGFFQLGDTPKQYITTNGWVAIFESEIEYNIAIESNTRDIDGITTDDVVTSFLIPK